MIDGLQGLFNLDMLESADDDDLLNLELTEDTHSGPSVPGGLNEKPAGRHLDQGPTPGSKVEIDVDTYNQALASLKKSFKEATEICDLLANTVVTEKTVEQRQDEYVEEAILRALEDGPIFEAVDRDDKEAVKSFTRKMRKSKELKKAIDDEGYVYRNISTISSILKKYWWNTRLWQVLGIVNIEEGNIQTLCKTLNNKFSEDLGDYKILPVRCLPNIIDHFIQWFGWKNTCSPWLLVVDKKMPGELKDGVGADKTKPSGSSAQAASSDKE